VASQLGVWLINQLVKSERSVFPEPVGDLLNAASRSFPGGSSLEVATTFAILAPIEFEAQKGYSLGELLIVS
jgi:hypothetical protein